MASPFHPAKHNTTPTTRPSPTSSSTTTSSSTWSYVTPPPMPESCTTRPTQTFYSTSGCDIACTDTAWCIMDCKPPDPLTRPYTQLMVNNDMKDAVTLSCGCTSVAVRPTTTTICPTKSNCQQCTTGWGIATIMQTGCSPAAVAAAAATEA
ncbi:hypothetical protein QBC46DRAFT_402596 [Diplogelasinospora grovesii]|uniref:Uncharacterized protein n=1 Tax=Diplogelasinospora grovesii TaxID=303347 RepID=A0AAN6NM86_9PEZI|nr:hypothetical protein QBC46DRAFT_402596 [Diplogelasinospora grovesii]